MSKVADRWVNTQLENLASDVSYGYTAKALPEAVGPHMLRITDIQNNAVDWNTVPFCMIDEKDKNRYILKDRDLVFARTGATVGKSFLIRGEIPESVYASYLIRVRCVDSSITEFLSYYFRSPEYWNQITDFSSGIGQPNVNGTKLKKLNIPLPPLKEQNRIVDKLERLLVRVEKVKETLEGVAKFIESFKKSVFLKAISGDLSEKYRGSKNTNNWVNVRADEICDKVQSGGTPKEGFIESGDIPFLKVYNMVNQCIDFEYRPQFISKEVHNGKSKKSIGYPDDVVMNIVGPPLGKVAVIPNTYKEWNMNQAITLFRPNKEISTSWLYINLCSGANIESIIHETRGSAGQSNISLTQCRKFIFPLPPKDEQMYIEQRVKDLFKFVDEIEEHYFKAKTQVDNLTPSILAKAFRGELVPQDPDDESAEILLQKIKKDQDKQALLDKIAKNQNKQKKGPSVSTRDSSEKDVKTILEALEEKGSELSSEHLFEAAGYPKDATSDLVEKFLIEVRDLLAQGEITKERKGNDDWFSVT